MTHVLIALVSLVAFALLALAMDRQQSDLFGRELPASLTRLLRSGGWAALTGSLALAVQAQGWALGLVAWCGHISFSAALVMLGLIAWDRRKA
ncbi:hypothetical protein CCO03_11110 [Comamonas serinivorans]|uniref:DUF3325 domain-containing protein n=1 Tax=Comamonas serinivorans TaxID=1082851 RepID=A0A1Y0ENJ1_9BURK|nr:DUF3325 domain-containing protein [Comamonas serinivorans]ARU05166.1 hypothetical protein CCO03_11110 [Comamonas serinivorans]